VSNEGNVVPINAAAAQVPAPTLDEFDTLEQLLLSKFATLMNNLGVRPDVVIAAASMLTSAELGLLIAFDLHFEKLQTPPERRALMLAYLDSGEPLIKLRGYARSM
jgi:hypothetical protein